MGESSQRRGQICVEHRVIENPLSHIGIQQGPLYNIVSRKQALSSTLKSTTPIEDMSHRSQQKPLMTIKVEPHQIKSLCSAHTSKNLPMYVLKQYPNIFHCMLYNTISNGPLVKSAAYYIVT